MDNHSFSRYLKNLSEAEIHNELMRYKKSIQENTIDICYRKWIVFGKKRRDLAYKRLSKEWAHRLDFINTKISEGSL